MVPRNKWLLLAAVWFVVIWVGLLRNNLGNDMPPMFPHFDKFAHCALFFAQIWLLARAWLAQQQRPPYLFLAIFALLFAAGSEIAQALFTQRTGDVWDMVADLVGASLALLLARNVSRNQLHLKQPNN